MLAAALALAQRNAGPHRPLSPVTTPQGLNYAEHYDSH